MDDPPPAHPLTVDLQCLGQKIEPAGDRSHRLRVAGKLGSPVTEERRSVQGALPDERLRVNCKPGLALGGEHVPAVEVLVQDHDLGLRGAEIVQEIERQIEE